MYIDSHSHFDISIEEKVDTEEALIAGLTDNNIKYAVQISTEAEGFNWSYELAKKHKNILFTIGIHPSSSASEKELICLSKFVEKIMKSDDSYLLFGIGETGLDYYRMRQPKDIQIHSFEYQIDVAKTWELPLIVHSRNASFETLKILEQKLPKTGIMHCFSGDKNIARKLLDIGFYISFAGNLTYKKAYNLQEAASYIPIDRLLLETDSPFLTPVPLRGKENRPEYVIHTYKFLANLRNENMTKIEDEIYNNFTLLNKH